MESDSIYDDHMDLPSEARERIWQERKDEFDMWFGMLLIGLGPVWQVVNCVCGVE